MYMEMSIWKALAPSFVCCRVNGLAGNSSIARGVQFKCSFSSAAVRSEVYKWSYKHFSKSFVYNVYIRVYQLLKKLSYKSPFREEMTSYLYWSGIREYRGHFLYIYLSYCYLFVLKENQPIKSQIQFIPSIKYLADLYLIKKENLPHPISVACKPIWLLAKRWSHYVGLLYVMIVKTTLRPLYPGMWSFLLRTFELSCSLPFVTLCKTMTSKPFYLLSSTFVFMFIKLGLKRE